MASNQIDLTGDSEPEDLTSNSSSNRVFSRDQARSRGLKHMRKTFSSADTVYNLEDDSNRYQGPGCFGCPAAKRSVFSSSNESFGSISQSNKSKPIVKEEVLDVEDDFTMRPVGRKRVRSIVESPASGISLFQEDGINEFAAHGKPKVAFEKAKQTLKKAGGSKEQASGSNANAKQSTPRKAGKLRIGGTIDLACSPNTPHSGQEHHSELGGTAGKTDSDLPGGHYDKFFCGICLKSFGRRDAVQEHFQTCAKRTGNPSGLKWDDHESLSAPSESKKQRADAYQFVPVYKEGCPPKPQPKSKPLVAPTNARIRAWPQPLRTLIYEGDVIYGCPKCSQFFTRKYNINRHLTEFCPNRESNKGQKVNTKDGERDEQDQVDMSGAVQCRYCEVYCKESSLEKHEAECREAMDLDDDNIEGGGSLAQSVPKSSKVAESPRVDIFAKLKKQAASKSSSRASSTPGHKGMLTDFGVHDLYDPEQIVTKRAHQVYEKQQRKIHKAERHRISTGSTKVVRFLNPVDDGDGDDEEIFDFSNHQDDTVLQNYDDDGAQSPQDEDMDVDSLGPVNTDDMEVDVSNISEAVNEHPGDKRSEFAKPGPATESTELPDTLRSDLQQTASSEDPDACAPDNAADLITQTTLQSLSLANDNDATEAINAAEKPLPTAQDAILAAASSHPSTGGKTLSSTSLAVWDADAANALVEDTQTPDMVYHYHILIRNWGFGLTEDSAPTKQQGPYLTLPEANAVAAQAVQSPIDRFAAMKALTDERDAEKRKVTGELGTDDEEGGSEAEAKKPKFKYSYVEDEHGMQTHQINLGGSHASAQVVRTVAPGTNTVALPVSAIRAPPSIYLVHLLKRFSSTPGKSGAPKSTSITTSTLSSDIDDLFVDSGSAAAATSNRGTADPSAPPDAESTILAAYTLPSLATKHAIKTFGDLKTKGMKPSDKETVRMGLRKEMEEWESEDWKIGGRFWEGSCAVREKVWDGEKAKGMEGGKGKEGKRVRVGDCAVWVAEVGVGGPRN